MGTIASQTAALQTIIDAVPDSGTVYDYQKLPDPHWSEFVKAFTVEVAGYAGGKAHIRGFTIQYVGEEREEETVAAIGNTKYWRRIKYAIRAYFATSDQYQSDKVFRDLLETVANALDSKPDLNGECHYHDPVSIDVDRGLPRDFGDVTVHWAEIKITVHEQHTLTTS